MARPELNFPAAFGQIPPMRASFAASSVLVLLVTLYGTGVCPAEDDSPLSEMLSRLVIGPDLALAEVENYCEARVPKVPAVESVDEWERLAGQWREQMLSQVVFRGEATQWRAAAKKVEWFETITGGDGYVIRKLRFEALPGLWIPALLYEPTNLSGKTPVVMNVNGHDGTGKAARYKQIRCINQAKRGMLALNVEWLGMGQLNASGLMHYRMNQLNLCGTSGLAPFYLALERGLDVLLDHEFADPSRVAVAGLSGGGWQTIFISSLDTRVTLTNPVAGYSSFLTRIRNHSDLGDSEQTPCDMATVADYAHLTAMLAPRAALLTFNAKDNCCFASGHALQPLWDVAEPIYRLYGKSTRLRSHVNYEPGNHNFEQDNREALYRMFAEHFYPDDLSFVAEELACEDELKTAEELTVPLPETNATFQTLATQLSESLPRDGRLPEVPDATWAANEQARLRELVRAPTYTVQAREVAQETMGNHHVRWWQLRCGDAWTVPAVEFSIPAAPRTVIVVADAGRVSTVARIQQLLDEGVNVLAVDPFYLGESKIKSRDFLFALLVEAVGDRPLGLQASQLGAVARWLKSDRHATTVTIHAQGERISLAALVAANLETTAIDRVELQAALGSLRQTIERNDAVNEKPELFCFGLLERFDIRQLVALVAPREVRFVEPSDRVQTELASLALWYQHHGKTFDPLK